MRKFNTRVLLILLAVVIIFLGARTLAVPSSFGELGWYRSASLEEVANESQSFADSHQCLECHPGEYTTWTIGEHQGVDCESCHGALKSHTWRPDEVEGYDDILSSHAYSSTQDFCLSCHIKSSSKPSKFPQISVTHKERWNCTQCHDPHNPLEGENEG